MTRFDATARKGAATVELALMLPFVCFLFAGTADFGRVFYYSQVVTNCARNGAIYGCDPVAAQSSPYTSLQQAALADAVNLNPQPTVTSTTGTDANGSPYVRVTVAWTFKSVAAVAGIPATLNLTRTIQMRMTPN